MRTKNKARYFQQNLGLKGDISLEEKEHWYSSLTYGDIKGESLEKPIQFLCPAVLCSCGKYFAIRVRFIVGTEFNFSRKLQSNKFEFKPDTWQSGDYLYCPHCRTKYKFEGYLKSAKPFYLEAIPTEKPADPYKYTIEEMDKDLPAGVYTDSLCVTLDSFPTKNDSTIECSTKDFGRKQRGD
jgi:hypothetical protein